MNILSVDYGTKYVGMALYNPEESKDIILFKPLQIPPTATKASDFSKRYKIISKEIKKYCRRYNIDTLVVGLPLQLDQKESSFSKEVLKFKKTLHKYLIFSSLKKKPEIILIEESMTSFVASKIPGIASIKSRQKRKKLLDSASAKIILEEFLINKGYTKI